MVLKSIQKYDFIDALRGFAILGVVVVHSSYYVAPSKSTKIICDIAHHGIYGVQLFFIVSSLTLFLSMDLRKKYEYFPLINYFIRRFFRIAPLFYLAIFVYMIVDGFSPRYWAPNGIEWYYVLLSVFFLHGWNPETMNSVVTGNWTIAVEMIFYLFVPFLYSHLKGIRSSLYFIISALIMSLIFSLAATSFLSPYYSESQQYLVVGFVDMWFFSQLPVFGLGILLYHIFKRYQNYKNRKFGLFLLLLSLSLFVFFLRVHSNKYFFPLHFLYGIILFIFALSLHFYPIKLLVNPITQWIGKISFSIYLTHFLVLKIMSCDIPKGYVNILTQFLIMKIMRYDYPGNLLFSLNIGFIVGFIFVLLFSVGFSAITYKIIEAPGIRFGKRLINKLETRAMISLKS